MNWYFEKVANYHFTPDEIKKIIYLYNEDQDPQRPLLDYKQIANEIKRTPPNVRKTIEKFVPHEKIRNNFGITHKQYKLILDDIEKLVKNKKQNKQIIEFIYKKYNIKFTIHTIIHIIKSNNYFGLKHSRVNNKSHHMNPLFTDKIKKELENFTLLESKKDISIRKSPKDIAKKFNIKYPKIKNRTFYNYILDHLGEFINLKKQRVITDNDKQNIITDYNNGITNQSVLSERHDNISRTSISGILHQALKEGKITKLLSPGEAHAEAKKEEIPSISQQGWLSKNELVVNDLLFICNIPYTRNTIYDKKKKGKWFPDYQINGFPVELFGGTHNSEANKKYNIKTINKIRVISNLRFLKKNILTELSEKRHVLLSWADALDNKICIKGNQCGPGLLFKPNEVQDKLKIVITLFNDPTLQLTTMYKLWLKANQHRLEDIRNKANEVRKNPALNQPLKLVAQNNFQHPSDDSLQKQPNPTHPPSLEEITQSLSQKYKSVEMWSDEEKIAVYFVTPEKLMSVMNQFNMNSENNLQNNQNLIFPQNSNIQNTQKPNDLPYYNPNNQSFPTEIPLARAASKNCNCGNNWYKRIF